MKKLSIGSWAYCFGPYKDNPVDFHTVVHKLSDLDWTGSSWVVSHPTRVRIRIQLRRSACISGRR